MKTPPPPAGTGYRKHIEGDASIDRLCEKPAGLFVDDSAVYITFIVGAKIRKIDRDGVISIIVNKAGKEGYSGDVPFDFEKYPHIGPKKKQWIKPFPKSFHDIVISTSCHSQ